MNSYWQVSANYYVPTNIFVPRGPTWSDNIEDPYLRDFDVAARHWRSIFVDDEYNQQPTCEFIDDVYVKNRSGFIDHHQGQANNHCVSRNIGDPRNLDHNYSAFIGS
ncbi:hypothetical protein HAX54_014400 [Datura stramonium]|uniref:Uncharacterized protein n=1 Tax=Datura stramonium TaxID=4076 RepID=A0ABS8Y481_DATST|nr:hypothetical protein [Datura stramonium]